jgi:hypothetical protein
MLLFHTSDAIVGKSPRILQSFYEARWATMVLRTDKNGSLWPINSDAKTRL